MALVPPSPVILHSCHDKYSPMHSPMRMRCNKLTVTSILSNSLQDLTSLTCCKFYYVRPSCMLLYEVLAALCILLRLYLCVTYIEPMCYIIPMCFVYSIKSVNCSGTRSQMLACTQVPREMLKEWAVVQGEATLRGVLVQTFTLQPRKQGSSSPFEHMAVQQACHRLLSNVSSASYAVWALLL